MNEKHDHIASTTSEARSELPIITIGAGKIVEFDKLFGPLIMTNIRVSIDVPRGEWIIEREIVPKEGMGGWEICARIDGQNSIDFTK